ncbi:MAG: DegT/DnrJ/EryC1/StrS family aminotransferase, partial [Fidelibacterota bacterium]
REEFIRALNGEGIPAYTGYKPVYREELFAVNHDGYPWLEGRDFRRLSLAVTEKICHEEAIWLRQTCLLGSTDDTMDIARALHKVSRHYSTGE